MLATSELAVLTSHVLVALLATQEIYPGTASLSHDELLGSACLFHSGTASLIYPGNANLFTLSCMTLLVNLIAKILQSGPGKGGSQILQSGPVKGGLKF